MFLNFFADLDILVGRIEDSCRLQPASDLWSHLFSQGLTVNKESQNDSDSAECEANKIYSLV